MVTHTGTGAGYPHPIVKVKIVKTGQLSKNHNMLYSAFIAYTFLYGIVNTFF